MSMENNSDISIGSLNVRGINDEIKRNSVFKWAKKKKFDILFLQETYSSVDNESRWKQEWGGDIFFAHGTKHSKGVMIMIKPKLDVEVIDTTMDKHGTFIVLTVNFMSEKFVFVNIYAPNKAAEKKFFSENYSLC